MKVCLLGQYPPHIGGVASHTYLLSRELQRRGDEVVVLTYPHPPQPPVDNITIISARAPNLKGLRGLFFTISAYFKLKKVIKDYQIDVVHAHFLLPPGLVAALARQNGVSNAVTIHGSDIFILAQKPFLKGIIKWVLSRMDYVMVVNHEIKQEVENMGIDPRKIHITPNAVDIEKFNPENHLPVDLKMDHSQKHLLFVGNLVYQKGLEYLLDAKKEMKSECQLLIVGEGPMRESLQSKVQNEGIPNVVFLGERRDVERIMPFADLFVLPSISEGSPITILESLASGVPVVATDVGGVKEILTPQVGRLVKPASPTRMAQTLDDILSDPELRTNMADNCRNTAKKFAYLKIPY